MEELKKQMIKYIYKNKNELEVNNIQDVNDLLNAIICNSKQFISTLKRSKYIYIKLPNLYVEEVKKPLYLKALQTLGLELRFEEDIILYR